jgi:hypothetical protein
MNPSVLIVYVQLGGNPSPTLQHYSKINSRSIPDSKSVLITDNPTEHSDFPGDVIPYTGEMSLPGFHTYTKSNQAYSNVAGGYWRFTMERLFALKILDEQYAEDCPILHLESDVLLLLDSTTLEKIKQKIMITSVPRYSSSDGIASILFAPSIRQLVQDLIKLDSMLMENLDVSSDMELLGLGLEHGVFGELPSHPRDALTVDVGDDQSTIRVVFDGAAYGQYLFGQDPVHTSNRVISGYLNPHFGVNLSQAHWSVKGRKDLQRPSFSWENRVYEVVNIHMHSKLLVDPCSSLMWDNILGEANGLSIRTAGPVVEDLIHTIPSSYIDRIRLIRRRGLKQSIYNRIVRALRKIYPR